MSKTYKLTHTRHDSSMTCAAMSEHANTHTKGVTVSVSFKAYSGHIIEHTFEAPDNAKAEEIARKILAELPFLVYSHELKEVTAAQ